MPWFSVHSIVTFRRIDLKGKINIYENIFLIEALNFQDAELKAIVFAKADIVQDNSLTIDDFPAFQKFEGIRKVVAVSNLLDDKQNQQIPTSGSEVSYIEYEVNSEDDLKKLLIGEVIHLNYIY